MSTSALAQVSSPSRDFSPDQLCYRLRPLEGRSYRPSFRRHCQRARFDSLEAAVTSVKSAAIEFEVYSEAMPTKA